MNKADEVHANALREALLSLAPAGQEGFEGFLGVILGEITGQSFRLAKSGSQHGRDGDSAFDGGATFFEGKRYRESLNKRDLSEKLVDIANDDNGQVDLWILGATCEVPSQDVTAVQKYAAKYGLGIVILDWSNNDLGSLLIATVVASSKAKEFITNGLTGSFNAHHVTPALKAIDYFEKHTDFPSRKKALKAALSEDIGLGHAKTLNQAWLDRLFRNKVRARAEFGQPLSPLDPTGLQALDRPESVSLNNAFSGEPESEIYAIIGEEGVGKSWLAAQSWSLSNPKSLLVICPAEDLIGDNEKDFDAFLIRQLIRQTGRQATPEAITRWQRRFDAWRANLPTSSVRISLIADGLNQPLKSDWGRWLNRAALHLKDLGGCLVITTRTQHWIHIKSTIDYKVKMITLAEWSIAEVKTILSSRGIDFSDARIEVLESIRNPRLLGIAIELLEDKTIELLDELSVGRLLFEHMRRMQQHGATPISAPAFADILKKLAAKILDRANKKNTDDLRLFDVAEESQLEAVASSQFFNSVKGRASQYEIKSDGLNLALALYLVDQLECELRNSHNPRDRLATILEPISALDETAQVVLLATQVACLDEETSLDIRSALIEKFVSLQNLPNSQVEAFAGLAKSASLAFLQASENIYLSQEHIHNDNWLLFALINRREEHVVWQQILESTKQWLCFYSLAPERRMHKTSNNYTVSEVHKERSKILADIQSREAALTPEEQSFIKMNLVPAPQPRYDELSRFAFYLLAGMPLKEVAPYLVCWRFSQALNQSMSAPYAEFLQTLHFNRTDWQETRSALLKSLETLPEEYSSKVGKWTRAGVLFGTGDIGDAQESALILEQLTRDQERFNGWSLNEEYCAVDPCNPGSDKPENVTNTSQNYKQINLAEVAIGRGLNQQDHFFRRARTGVARFMLDDAIYTHRKLANDVLSRNGYARRQGVLELMRHSAALTKDQALSFLSSGVSSTTSYKDSKHDQDEFLTAQFSILIALPHLTADEQFEAIANMKGDDISVELLTCVRKATPEKVEEILERLLQRGDEQKTAVLAAIHYSQALLTPRAAIIVKGFIRSPLKSVQKNALAISASTGDTSLLQEVVDSGWRAEMSRDRDSSYDDWHGSTAILKALELGLISTEDALNRINLSHYGFAAKILPTEQVNAIARRIEIALAKALSFEGNIELPDIETGIPNISAPTPSLISLSERVSSEIDFLSQMNRLAETDDQFYERQRHLSDTYKTFVGELTSTEAGLILSDLTFEGLKAVIEQDEELAIRWLRMLEATTDRKLQNLYHVAVQVAVTLIASGNSLAHDLLIRVLKLEPTIRRVTGAAKIPMEAIILWTNSTSSEILDICKNRLQTPRTDGDIAREVIAAQICGKVHLLQTYIDELLAMKRPYETALALMIAGYCDESPHAGTVLARFDSAKGFIGTAHAAASNSYAKSTWAKNWYANMLNAERTEDFWRASVLFMKIVDGRFDLWSEASDTPSTIFSAFMPTINKAIESRVAKVQKNREKELFGGKAPASIMLPAK